MKGGWIKLHRKMIDWQWYRKSEILHLFIHCLLKANHAERKWGETVVNRGEFITGLKSLSIETGISTQKLRTCIAKLKKSGELTSKSTNKYTVVTVVNYNDYQIVDDEVNKQTNKQLTNKQQTTNKQLTTNKNDKNIKNDKKEVIKEEKIKHLEFVYLTLKQYANLILWYGNDVTGNYIQRLNNYIGQIGERKANLKYKSHYHVILNWVNMDGTKKKSSPKPQSKLPKFNEDTEFCCSICKQVKLKKHRAYDGDMQVCDVCSPRNRGQKESKEKISNVVTDLSTKLGVK